MVVDDFNIMGTVVGPHKTYPPLVVDADAVLPRSVTSQPLKAGTRRSAQVIQSARHRELGKFSQCHPFDVDPTSHSLALIERIGIYAAKGLEGHAKYY